MTTVSSDSPPDRDETADSRIYIAMIFDLHNDLPTADLPSDAIEKELCKPWAKRTVFACWTGKTPQQQAKAVVARVYRQVCAAQVLFGIEDLHFLQEGDLPWLQSLQPLYCGLTWNDDNRLAGGALGSAALTAFGGRVIDAMNDAGICLDTAHLHRNAFFAAVERAEHVLNSHTCLRAVHDHPRNVDDEQVRMIVQKGGVVGGTTPLPQLKSYASFARLRDRLAALGYDKATIRNIFYQNAKNFIKTITGVSKPCKRTCTKIR